MANPTTRDELKNYCLRRLGHPVIEINIDEDQMQDRIDDALEFYREYHYDGTERTYVKHQLTSTDISNEYITISSDIHSITGIFDIKFGGSSGNQLSSEYQLTSAAVASISTGGGLSNYVETKRSLELMDEILTGKVPIRFNRHTDKLYIDWNWAKATAGEYVVLHCYRILDGATYASVWGDWWLRKYLTALFKLQWGENISKFIGMQLPGGVQFNGERILNEAREDIAKLEEEVINKHSLPVFDMIG
jgi:hypothetical protein